MTPEEEREALEEMAVAGVTLAIHIAEDERARAELEKLSPYTQRLIFGVTLASRRLRQTEPKNWVRSASQRLSKLSLEAMNEIVDEEIAKAKAGLS